MQPERPAGDQNGELEGGGRAGAAPGPAGQEQAGGGNLVVAAGPDAELAAEAMRQAAAATLLPFQRSLIEELLEEDGLVVLSPGLGLQQVVAVLLRLQDARLRQPGQSGVVLVLGASPWQRDALRRELRRIDPTIQARAAAVGGGSRGAAGGWRGQLSRQLGVVGCSCCSLVMLRAWHNDALGPVANLFTPHKPYPLPPPHAVQPPLHSRCRPR